MNVCYLFVLVFGECEGICFVGDGNKVDLVSNVWGMHGRRVIVV